MTKRAMTNETGQPSDTETPEPDAFEQSLVVGDDEDAEDGVEGLPRDAEVPEPDAYEQHQPAPVDDDGWR